MRRILQALAMTLPFTAAGHAQVLAAGLNLPDSPGALFPQAHPSPAPQQYQTPVPPNPCSNPFYISEDMDYAVAIRLAPCPPRPDPYKPFLDTGTPIPLSPAQKGYLAYRDVVDPFNLLTIVGNSALTIGFDSDTPYGPGLKGFGRNVGVSLLQDVTGEFIGTFAVCSLFHQDPHYHRMPGSKPLRRLVHAISRTVIAQHDDGTPMPNYENFITYPASAEISNLYVPGIAGNGPSTVKRILTGLATDPINNIITEFLPDVARRIHIRVVFVQQILNQVAASQQMAAAAEN